MFNNLNSNINVNVENPTIRIHELIYVALKSCIPTYFYSRLYKEVFRIVIISI